MIKNEEIIEIIRECFADLTWYPFIEKFHVKNKEFFVGQADTFKRGWNCFGKSRKIYENLLTKFYVYINM